MRILVGTLLILSPTTAIAAEIGCDLFFTEQDAARSTAETGRWIGSSKADLSAFPDDVKSRVGGALWEAQIGGKAPFAKPLKGFDGAGVLEVVDDFDGDAYRAVYTVRFTVSSTSCTPSRRSQGGP